MKNLKPRNERVWMSLARTRAFPETNSQIICLGRQPPERSFYHCGVEFPRDFTKIIFHFPLRNFLIQAAPLFRYCHP